MANSTTPAATTRTTPGRITILYGSQTGNAEDMAKRVGLQAKSLGYQVLVETMDDFPLKELPKQRHLVIFICSTTGHGQEPENMRTLFNFMRRKDLPKDCLSQLSFAVYGLGDSSYAKFNYVSKILYKRLRECGAKPVQELVTGDEQHLYGCDGVIYPKLEELWNAIRAQNDCDTLQGQQSQGVIENGTMTKSSYTISFYSPDEDCPRPSDKFNSEFRSRYDLKEAVCLVNKQITAESHFQDTRFLCFKSRHEEIHYEPGDVCTIHPENSPENVQDFLGLLNLDSKQRVRLHKVDPNYMLNYLYDFAPDGLEVQDLVRYYLDIQSVPKRSFFEFLWPFSDDQLERDKLKEFASTEGQEEVYEYCTRPKRSILETLMDFPNTIKNIKFEYLLDMIPPIKPRSFSIASASRVRPNEIHLIVGVVTYRTSMKKLRRGLCSSYLARLEPVESVEIATPASLMHFFIRRSSFKLPRDDRVPIVMIGPGLGLAPFRGFIEDRYARSISGEPMSPANQAHNNHLYFGCRFADKDYYFKDELESYANEKSAIRLEVAFSRQEPKQYVQDLLLADAKLIHKLLLDDKAIFYVAGNSKLPEELRTLLAKILTQEVGDSEGRSMEEVGGKMVDHLEASNRIQYDCW